MKGQTNIINAMLLSFIVVTMGVSVTLLAFNMLQNKYYNFKESIKLAERQLKASLLIEYVQFDNASRILKMYITNNGDILGGNNYKFSFDFNTKPFKPNENIVINFSGRLAEIYERYSLEKISNLKIIPTSDTSNFSSTIKVTNIISGNTTPINGGNNIEQGEQSKINIHYIYNNEDSVCEDIVGNKNLSDIEFSSGGSGLESDPSSPHGPVSIEPPTINPNIPSEEEYLRLYKRHEEHPNLQLE